MLSRWLIRALSWIVAAVIGGFFGVAGTIAHSVTWGPVPVGIVVSSITCLALLVAIRALTRDRFTALAAGAGMLGMLVLISGVGPGGSVVVPDTPLAKVWLVIVAAAVLLVVAWPTISRFAPEPPASEMAPTAESLHNSRRLDM